MSFFKRVKVLDTKSPISGSEGIITPLAMSLSTSNLSAVCSKADLGCAL